MRAFLTSLAVATLPISAASASCDSQVNCSPVDDVAAAVTVLRTYYQALAARDYRTAYAQWGNAGAASGQSFEAFASGFAKTRTTQASIGIAGPPDGAAGSIFITIPVDVHALLTDGTAQHFAGSYTLRRVNNVPGATADQLRWHIQSAKLRVVKP